MTHDELRALCKAATPGPWNEGYWDGRFHVETREILLVQDMEPVDDKKQAMQNATYIAAVSPDVVLGLLDEIARLKRTLRWYAQVGSAWRQQAKAERDRMVADQCCTDYPTCTCRGKFL